MDSIRDRARENFPSVLLTLLSIVQAIAFESLWQHSRNRPELYEASSTALLGWLQITTSLGIIILIWLTYVVLVMRFRFTPTIMDLTLPFFIGLIEFLMVEMTVLDKLGQWFLELALVSALMNFLNHRFYRRARHDPDNQEFLRHLHLQRGETLSRKSYPLSLQHCSVFGCW